MTRALAILLLCLLALPAGPASAAGLGLPPFEASYRLTLDHIPIGRSRARLLPAEDGRYRYLSDTWPTGLMAWVRKDRLHEESLFIPWQGGVRPLSYRFDRTGGRKVRHARLSFDWKGMRVTNRVQGRPWKMAIPPGTLDKNLVRLAVMLDLARGRKTLAYAIADGGKLKHYRFAVVGRARIHTPAGDYDTLKLKRLRKDRDRDTWFWCAPALHYLPVRILQIENEDHVRYESLLEALRIDSSSTTHGIHQPPGNLTEIKTLQIKNH